MELFYLIYLCLDFWKESRPFFLSPFVYLPFTALLSLFFILFHDVVAALRNSEIKVDNYTVYKSLRQIKSNKSAGPDPIPGRVWKEFAMELSPIVMDIYNASMSQGYVPQRIKQSEVVPVPKCSPPKSVEQDLRPITLTSHLSKIMEGFTLQPLFDQVCENLDDKQFALEGKSTTHALVYLLHVISAVPR